MAGSKPWPVPYPSAQPKEVKRGFCILCYRENPQDPGLAVTKGARNRILVSLDAMTADGKERVFRIPIMRLCRRHATEVEHQFRPLEPGSKEFEDMPEAQQAGLLDMLEGEAKHERGTKHPG